MKFKFKDQRTYEIEEFPNGEAYIEIPDEEIFKVLVLLCKNERMIEKYKKELLDVFEPELQKYAENQFYEKGRGEIIK